MIAFLAILLAWNPSPRATGYRVLRDGIEVIESPVSIADVPLPVGRSVVTVTAFNPSGEAIPSEPITVTVGVLPVLEVMQVSANLVDWFEIPSMEAYAICRRRDWFARIKKVYP